MILPSLDESSALRESQEVKNGLETKPEWMSHSSIFRVYARTNIPFVCVGLMVRTHPPKKAEAKTCAVPYVP
jgi:hypothetical protein